MNLDDPEIRARIEAIRAQAENMDKLILAVLKTHVLTEQIMNDYMTTSGLKKRWIAKRYSEKMTKCKTLSKDEANDPHWNALEKGNFLRNTIAHTMDMEQINEKMGELKEAYFACLTAEQVGGIKDQPNDYLAMSAFSSCGGFIATLESRIPPKG